MIRIGQSKFMSNFKYYVLLIALFEVLPLLQLFVAKQPLHVVNPYYAPDAPADVLTLHGGLLVTLIVARMAMFFNPRSLDIWFFNVFLMRMDDVVFVVLYLWNMLYYV